MKTPGTWHRRGRIPYSGISSFPEEKRDQDNTGAREGREQRVRVSFPRQAGENAGWERFEEKIITSEDARHDTVRRARVLASTTARMVAGEEDVRRVRVGGREGGKGTGEREERKRGGKAGKQAATMSSSSRRPDAHRLLPWRRRDVPGGGMRGVRERQVEERGEMMARTFPTSLEIPPEQDGMLLPGGGKQQAAGDGIPGLITMSDD